MKSLWKKVVSVTMGWMLPLVSLLGVVVVVAGQTTTTTSGQSGPLCGRGSHCVSQAQCGIGGGMCECHTPWVGNGKLGCVEPLYPTCWLQDDPHLKNLYKEWLTLETPCRFRLMQYIIPVGPAACQVEVYADNKFCSEGLYYIERVELRINVLSQERASTLGVLIEGHAEDGVYTFREWRRKNSQKEWRSPNSQNDHVGNVKVPSHYDQVDNFAEIEAEKCGLKLKFRPADDKKHKQTQVPGLVVILDKDKTDQMTFNPEDLSSTPTGPSIREEAESRNVTLSVWTLDLAFTNTEFIDSMEPACDKVTMDIQNLCSWEQDRLNAIELCEGIFNDPDFLTCMGEQKDQLPADFQVKTFGNCISGYCLPDSSKCIQAKQAIQSINCPTPQLLAQFNCIIHGGNPSPP